MIRLTWTEYIGRADTAGWLYDWQNDNEEISGGGSVADEVEEALDYAHPEVPEEVVIHAFAREAPPAVTSTADDTLDRLLEWLDEEFGDPDGPTEATPAMRLAMQEAVRVVLAEYTVWRCEPVAEIVVTRADLPALWAALAAAKGGET